MSDDPPQPSEHLALVDALRAACVDRLHHDYEQAAIQGLCGEGAFEYALDRLRHVPATELLAAARSDFTAPADQETDP